MKHPVSNSLARLAALASAAALFGFAAPAFAQSSNLNLWTKAGDARIDLTSEVVLTTASVESGETPLTANSALLYYDLEPALSLQPGVLPADTYEGSGIQQSFTAAAGTTISFDWSLSTENYDPAFADRAFVIVGGSTILPLGTVAASMVSGSFTYTFASAGSQSFAIVLMDVNDTVGRSLLNAHGFTVSSVPEPTTVVLLLAGIGIVAGVARRQRQHLRDSAQSAA